jgi:6-pyruvoyltetrahydropterin/6-carboxytetrahydropterin synthase
MTPKIRITREFSFEMAHVLWNYDGPCRNVHGHSYRLFVTISGTPVDDPDNPKYGMIMDFGDLKKIVMTEIISKFDHAVVVSDGYDEDKTRMFRELFGNVVVVHYQPTCENLITDFAARLVRLLPPETSLHSLRLFETANSSAEWYASDNE